MMLLLFRLLCQRIHRTFFIQSGQFLTLSQTIDGEDVRRHTLFAVRRKSLRVDQNYTNGLF